MKMWRLILMWMTAACSFVKFLSVITIILKEIVINNYCPILKLTFLIVLQT